MYKKVTVCILSSSIDIMFEHVGLRHIVCSLMPNCLFFDTRFARDTSLYYTI